MEKTILAITTHVKKWGAERSMCMVLNALSKHGFRVILIIPRHGPIEELLNDYNLEYYISDVNNAATLRKKTLYEKIRDYIVFNKRQLSTSKAIVKLLEEKGIVPNIVYTNTIIPSTGIALCRFYKIPHIIHIREITDEDFKFIFHIGKSRYLKTLNETLHTAICISQVVQNKFLPYFGTKARLVYNGLPIPDTLYHERHITAHTKLVLVCRLSEEKGVMHVLNALKTICNNNEIYLDIWGDGPDKTYIQTVIKKNNLAKYISLKGYGNNINLYDYDIALMPSRAEAFGRTTVEYMMAELPVIGYYGGATPEIVLDGETGLIYHDDYELADKILYLSQNSEERISMGKKGRLRALEFFSEKKCVEKICDIFANVI